MASRLHQDRTVMTDLLFLAVTAAFFALAVVYTRYLDRI